MLVVKKVVYAAVYVGRFGLSLIKTKTRTI